MFSPPLSAVLSSLLPPCHLQCKCPYVLVYYVSSETKLARDRENCHLLTQVSPGLKGPNVGLFRPLLANVGRTNGSADGAR